MFETVIVDQNPHWDGTQYDGGVPRSILEEVKKNFDLPYILSIVGVRRCGKAHYEQKKRSLSSPALTRGCCLPNS